MWHGRRHELGGAPVVVGDEVMVARRALRNGEWRSSKQSGEVTGITTPTTACGCSTSATGHGDFDYRVFPRHVTDVQSGSDETRASFGVAVPKLTLPNGDVVQAGDTVRYDGRADGAFSEARVVRVIRDSNPQGDENNADWVLEAVTTGHSMSPGQRVLLTDARTGSQISRIGTSNVPIGGEGARRTVSPLTLERKSSLQQRSVMAPGTQPVALPQIVAADQPRPSRLGRRSHGSPTLPHHGPTHRRRMSSAMTGSRSTVRRFMRRSGPGWRICR